MADSPGNPKVSRRLAAILAADIAGYSALMGADEVRTVADLKAHQAPRNATVEPARRMEFRIGINLGDVIHDGRSSFAEWRPHTRHGRRWYPCGIWQRRKRCR
jgi:class 3 adenylate cyclase